MSSIIEGYLRAVESSLRVDAGRKRHIVDELRAHLVEKVNDLQAERPGASRLDLEREVLADLGDPRELALAYEPEGTAVLRNHAGDIVLRLGHAVGRGAKAAARGTGVLMKWLAIAVAGLLVLAIGLGIWAFYEVRPVVEALAQDADPVYEYHEACAWTPCSGAIPADVFHVGPNETIVRLSIQLHAIHRDATAAGNGTVNVTVTDPAGVLVFARDFDVTNGTSLLRETRLQAVEGNWTVAYAYNGFVGALDVRAYTGAVDWSGL